MKRFALGIVILILTVSVSAVSQRMLLNDAQMLIDKTQGVLASTDENSKEKLNVKVKDLDDSFKKVEKKLNIILCHSDMEGIENDISALKSYLKINDINAFKLCCIQIDAKTGNQLAFKNVIVMETEIGIASNGVHKDVNCKGGKDSVAYYISNGKVQKIHWEKENGDAKSRLVFFDDNGDEIKVNKGKTYIAVNYANQTEFN